MIADKKDLRVKYRQVRKNANSAKKDKVISDIFLKSKVFSEADTVLFYSSLGSEVSTREMIQSALNKGKTVALPKCLDKKGSMVFYVICDSASCIKIGAFSISEPDTDICPEVSLTDKTVCVVPALAFDRKGFRLGYGKGYYDRFLSKFKGVSVGLCYNECLCDELPFDEYDRKIDMIITDKEILNFSKEEYIYG